MDGVKVVGLLTLSIPLFVMVTRYYSKQQQQQQQHFEEEEEKEKEKDEEQEQVKATASVYWAELDQNVLGEILGRLCLTDQARFRAVCTNWLVASHSHSHSAFKTKSLPWHGCKYPRSSKFQIYDPLSSPNHLASRQIITWSDFGIQSPDYVNVIGIKHDWLILSLIKKLWFVWKGRYVLLFSPLTKRIITLPKFDYPKRFLFRSTFSTTHPDSQDCVFCLVDARQVDKIHVLTYRYGDKEWTATEFNRHPHFHPCIFTPHIISGILYIVSPLGGQVASYNILNGEFSFDLLLDEFIVQNSSYGHRAIRSFVLNGELMILCFNQDVKEDAAAIPGQQFIRRYDRLLKVWIPVTTLADYALFFSTRFINVSLINTKDDMTCNGVLPNKVYRFFNGGCLVYSLEDGRLVQFKSINSNLLEDGGDNLPEYKYNYDFPETPLSYWLEAPRIRSSSDNQEVRSFRSFRDEGKQGTVRARG